MISDWSEYKLKPVLVALISQDGCFNTSSLDQFMLNEATLIIVHITKCAPTLKNKQSVFLHIHIPFVCTHTGQCGCVCT